MGDFLENLTSDVTVGAVAIDYLPLPEGSLKGWMPFNPEQGQGQKENLLVRAALATPFLLISAFAWRLLRSAPSASTGDVVDSAWWGTIGSAASIDGMSWAFAETNRYVL